MDHRTALATLRTVALRAGRNAGTAAGRTAGQVRRQVVLRIDARRSAGAATPPPGPTTPPDRAPGVGTPAAAPHRRSTPSPADVARAVRRNAAGLTRTAPRTERARPRRSGPGAKLPARSGQGILGV